MSTEYTRACNLACVCCAYVRCMYVCAVHVCCVCIHVCSRVAERTEMEHNGNASRLIYSI
jgi:hypothetical protein